MNTELKITKDIINYNNSFVFLKYLFNKKMYSFFSVEDKKNVKENQISDSVTSKCGDYTQTGKHINDHDSSHTQAHFTPYNQLVLSKIKSETGIESVFAVDNYELPN